MEIFRRAPVEVEDAPAAFSVGRCGRREGKMPRSVGRRAVLRDARDAPRTADGKPDFSGIWRPERNQVCPPDGCPDNQMSEQFLDLGWGIKGGLPYQPWAAALVKELGLTDADIDVNKYSDLSLLDDAAKRLK